MIVNIVNRVRAFETKKSIFNLVAKFEVFEVIIWIKN